ncbi:hypothetical protein BGX28_004297 [Mortierella sp. GBA30]|nr:hypothetical protein BGX28_004297 [Mortierella sp. GBA30]
MLFKRSTLILLTLVLAASLVGAQTDVNQQLPGESTSNAAPPLTSSSPTPASPSPTPPTVTTEPPVTHTQDPSTTTHTVAPTQAPVSTQESSRRGQATTGGTVQTSSAATATSGAPTTTQTPNKEDSKTGASLATAGIVVGAIVVAAAIGIWIFRKWKLSPSRDFQSKIRGDGDDYQDYPRSYESDTVFLRNLGDQPTEPAPAKSPYNAGANLPAEDQYYDASYATDHHQAAGGYNQHDGYGGHAHAGYDQAGYEHQQGYEQQGYDHGYDQYGHNDYAQSQVGGGYAASQVGGGGYAASQVGGGYAQSQVGGYSQGGGGYAQSNVGGGYQNHGY